MIRAIVLCLLIGTLFSCSKDDDFTFDDTFNQFPQKWQLVKMTGQIANSKTTGAGMSWQEYYLLNSDGTFKKSRDRSGEITEVSGRFAFEELADGKYLVLTYEKDNSILGNCWPEPIETLKFESDNIVYSTWFACDGPGLEYKRVE